MKTIIAEKPSVAREIARIVGATKREEGYFEGGGYAVTWAFGHLVQLAMPDGYGIRGFVRDNLPVIPDTFTLVPRQVKTEKGYKPDSGVVTQIKTVTRLFKESEQIIVATDAGREGELIFRYLYHYTGCATPFVRLWISSLTDKAIREGLRNLEAGGKYDDLYLAAKARSESDWLVGSATFLPLASVPYSMPPGAPGPYRRRAGKPPATIKFSRSCQHVGPQPFHPPDGAHP